MGFNDFQKMSIQKLHYSLPTRKEKSVCAITSLYNNYNIIIANCKYGLTRT